ncbi:Leucine-rich repeat containing protein [Entamoeba marina]
MSKLSVDSFLEVIPYLITYQNALNFSFVCKKTLLSIKNIRVNPCYRVEFNGKLYVANTSQLLNELKLFSEITTFNCGSHIEKLEAQCKEFDLIIHSTGAVPPSLTNKVLDLPYIPEQPSKYSNLQTIITVYPANFQLLSQFKSLKKVIVVTTEATIFSQLYNDLLSLPTTLSVIIHCDFIGAEDLKYLQKTKAFVVSKNWKDSITLNVDKMSLYLSQWNTNIGNKVLDYLPHTVDIYTNKTMILDQEDCEYVSGVIDLKKLNGVCNLNITGERNLTLQFELPKSVEQITSNYEILNLNTLQYLYSLTITSSIPPLNLTKLHELKLSYATNNVNLIDCTNLQVVEITNSKFQYINLPKSLITLSIRKCTIKELNVPFDVEKLIIDTCPELQVLPEIHEVKLIGATLMNCSKLEPINLNETTLKSLLYKENENKIKNLLTLKEQGVHCLVL